MLDAFIIEELRRREERERGQAEQPRMELPLEERRERLPSPREDEKSERNPERGVVIIDF
jgi:hypothetical protein